MRHENIETHVGFMLLFILIVISLGGLAEIIPLMFTKQTTEPVAGLQPLTPLQLEGRDIYIREGCYVCHSQMIRPFRAETERYGHYSVAGESVYEHPFLWGAHRTGPDLARVGGRYSDEWHRLHLTDPRSVVPDSIMPAYLWLNERYIVAEKTPRKMQVLRKLGVPYTDEDIMNATQQVMNKTEMDALVAYLQQLGTALKKKG